MRTLARLMKYRIHLFAKTSFKYLRKTFNLLLNKLYKNSWENIRFFVSLTWSIFLSSDKRSTSCSENILTNFEFIFECNFDVSSSLLISLNISFDFFIFMSQTGGRIWSSPVHTDYSNRVVDYCWLDKCFSCKLLNISTHCLFWSSMTLSLVIHEYLNSRAIHNEVLFLSSSWLVLYLQFLILVSNFNFLLFLDSNSWHYKSFAHTLSVFCLHHIDLIAVDFCW